MSNPDFDKWREAQLNEHLSAPPDYAYYDEDTTDEDRMEQKGEAVKHENIS